MNKNELIVKELIDLKAITIKDVLDNIINKKVNFKNEEDEIYINNTTLWELCDASDCQKYTDIQRYSKVKTVIEENYSRDTFLLFLKELEKLNMLVFAVEDKGLRTPIFVYVTIDTDFNKDNISFNWLKKITLNKLKFYMYNFIKEWSQLEDIEVEECYKCIEVNVPKDWTLYDLLYTDDKKLFDWTFMNSEIYHILVEDVLPWFGIKSSDTYKSIDEYKKDVGNYDNAIFYYYYVGTNLEYNKTLKKPQKQQIWRNKVDNTYIQIVDKLYNNLNKAFYLYAKCNMEYKYTDIYCSINTQVDQKVMEEDVLLNEFEYITETEEDGFCYGSDSIMLDVLMDHNNIELEKVTSPQNLKEVI